MIRNGDPYIPPQPLCPAAREGDEFTVAPDMFELLVSDGVTDGISRIRLTAVAGIFYPKNGWEDDTYVATDLVQLPSSTELAAKARALEDGGVDRRIGEIFCERIKTCPGVLEGECAALGKQAVVEVIEQIAEENDL